jgi:hypothetical protein
VDAGAGAWERNRQETVEIIAIAEGALIEGLEALPLAGAEPEDEHYTENGISSIRLFDGRTIFEDPPPTMRLL